LREDVGEVLDEALIASWLKKYGNAVTCVCFMGGDAEPREVARLAAFVRTVAGSRIKAGWYSGANGLPDGVSPASFDYLKLGAYVERLGGLDSPTTNQRFYRIENGKMTDDTYRFSIKN
jgi:anaerobic ribonucleoside-triphosphate reductase activating protein